MAIQSLMPPDQKSFQEIIENKVAFKLIIKSSLSADEWRFFNTLLIIHIITTELENLENKTGVQNIIQKILDKREDQLFS